MTHFALPIDPAIVETLPEHEQEKANSDEHLDPTLLEPQPDAEPAPAWPYACDKCDGAIHWTEDQDPHVKKGRRR